MVNRILYSTSAQKVLGFLLENPEIKFYDREISRLSGVKKSSANYSLRSLVDAGLVLTEGKGRMLFYYVTLKDPLIRQLKKTRTLINLREISESLNPVSVEIILYGKAAEGADTPRDGIDLLVVSGSNREAAETVRGSSLSEKINLLIKTPASYINLKKDNPLIFRDVEKGISLY